MNGEQLMRLLPGGAGDLPSPFIGSFWKNGSSGSHSSSTTEPHGYASSDGTRFFYAGYLEDGGEPRLCWLDVGTPWDLSTITNSGGIYDEWFFPDNFTMSTNGLYVFYTRGGMMFREKFFQAWNKPGNYTFFEANGYKTKSLVTDILATFSNPYKDSLGGVGVAFKPDGTAIYAVARVRTSENNITWTDRGTSIYIFNLSIAWDPSTAVYEKKMALPEYDIPGYPYRYPYELKVAGNGKYIMLRTIDSLDNVIWGTAYVYQFKTAWDFTPQLSTNKKYIGTRAFNQFVTADGIRCFNIAEGLSLSTSTLY